MLESDHNRIVSATYLNKGKIKTLVIEYAFGFLYNRGLLFIT